jgi:8-oxo-dGTP pyrophosphatase MutT (NUDIX family)
MGSEITSNGADDETVWRPHVTVATIVPKDGRFLLVEEDVRGRLLLNQPAGHLEADESLLDAARRETLEETGWDVELDALVAVHQWVNPTSHRAFVRFTFSARPERHHPHRTLDSGVRGALWLARNEIAASADRLRSPMILASIDAWIGGQRVPLSTIRQIED